MKNVMKKLFCMVALCVMATVTFGTTVHAKLDYLPSATMPNGYVLSETDQVIVDLVVKKVRAIISEDSNKKDPILNALSAYAKKHEQTKQKIANILMASVLVIGSDLDIKTDTTNDTDQNDTTDNDTETGNEGETDNTPDANVQAVLDQYDLTMNTVYIGQDTLDGKRYEVAMITHEDGVVIYNENDFLSLDKPHYDGNYDTDVLDRLSGLREVKSYDKETELMSFLKDNQYYFIFTAQTADNETQTKTVNYLEYNAGANNITHDNQLIEDNGIVYMPYHREKEYVAAIGYDLSLDNPFADVSDSFVFNFDDEIVQNIGPAAVQDFVRNNFHTYIDIDTKGTVDDYKYKAYSKSGTEVCDPQQETRDCYFINATDKERATYSVANSYVREDLDR